MTLDYTEKDLCTMTRVLISGKRGIFPFLASEKYPGLGKSTLNATDSCRVSLIKSVFMMERQIRLERSVFW
jgi:hypothetical protein